MAMIENRGGNSICPEGWKNVTIVDEREFKQWERRDTGSRIRDEDLDKYSNEEKVLKDKLQFFYETDDLDENGDPYRISGRAMNFKASGAKAAFTLFLKEVKPELVDKGFDTRDEIVGLRFRCRIDHQKKQDGNGVFVNIGVHTPIENQGSATASDIPSHRG